MQINYRAYPHPVLSYFSDDYVRCLYQTVVNTTVSQNTYKFSVVSKTSSRGLLEMIAAGNAVHAIHVECSATRYRRVYKSNTDTFDIEVPAELLDGRVQLCSFIIAAKNIDSYASGEFHPDFGGRNFKIRKGDVLAVDRDRTFIAEKEHDPLRKLPSIFTISTNSASGAPSIDIDLTRDNKIVILLSENMHNAYKKIAADKSMTHVLSSMVVVPALITVLEAINAALVAGDIGEFEEKRWFRVVASKLKEAGYSLTDRDVGFSDSTLVIAQRLIGQPLALALRTLVAYEESETE